MRKKRAVPRKSLKPRSGIKKRELKVSDTTMKSKRTVKPVAGSQSRISDLESALKLLRESVNKPFHVRRHEMLAASTNLHPTGLLTTKALRIGFRKEAGGPDLVRVTLDNVEEVLKPGNSEGESQPRVVGTWVSALIEVAGNSGAKAKIVVKNAKPTQIVVDVPAGDTGTWATQPLLVEEEGA